MFGLIFGVSLLNLSLPTGEYCKSFQNKAASFFPPPPKPEGGSGGQGHGGGSGGGKG
jgi:hypothetical protein